MKTIVNGKYFRPFLIGACVVVILGIFAGMCPMSCRATMAIGQIGRAKTEMHTLAAALMNYAATFGELPLPKTGTGAHYRLSTEEYLTLLDFIGTPRPGHATNSRKSTFLDLSDPGEFLDPWRHTYVMVFDCTGKGKVTANPVPGGGPWCDVPAPFAIWSRGADYQPGPPETGDTLGKPGKSAKDEVNGWE